MTKRLKKAHKNAVLLVGAGYGALKTAEDLAQSGIPVVWVTKARHFLELPGGIESFKEWPEDLNFQFRPLYLRVTRNPLVMAVTRARVESIKKVKDDFKVAVRLDPQYVDYDLCTGCGKCMEICPLNDTDHPPLTRTPNYCPSRALDLEKRKISPCRVTCPLGVNAQAYMALTAASRFDEALEVIREDNPLPGICGRVCHHPCESECRRGELDKPLAIRDIKRFLTDREAEKAEPSLKIPPRKMRTEKVAVIGSGPSGLTAAHFLNREGFQVTVFESLPVAGGMLRAGINAFRLPRRVLDAEIAAIEKSGVEIRTGVTVGSASELLEKGYRAVILCTGTHRDLRLNIPGEDLEGVAHCVEFLCGVNLDGKGDVGEHTVVIGAGNSAMDAARTALRLGAGKVTVLAIEKESEMPANPREVKEAREEGVEFMLGTAPIEFKGKGGKVTKIVCQPAHWDFSGGGPPCIVYDSDKTTTVEADKVIVSIGQQPHLDECGIGDEIERGRGGRVTVDEKACTSCDGIFAAGDVVTGPSTVIGSMADGRSVAGRVMEYLTGEPSPYIKLEPETRGVGDYLEITEDTPRMWPPDMPQRQPKVRCRDFDEVDLGFTVDQAVTEAGRCLQCASCCECRACEEACVDIGAINHFREVKRIEVTSPSVIIADKNEWSFKDLLGAEGVYNIDEFDGTIDLMNVLVAGSAVAGKAMELAAALRTEATFEESKPFTMPPEPRLGVFLCTCNGTMASASALERIRELAESIPGVMHSELIFSACHPKGANRIAEVIKERRLSRVIMASCVCCPLEFQCISCNDQRLRARIHLFDRLGLDRNYFEMVNIRDHISTGVESDDEVVEKAREIMRQAYIRARHLEPLRSGFTEMKRRILVLGASEVGVSCALNLDHQGFKVRLVHNCWIAGQPRHTHKNRKFSQTSKLGRNITHINEAEIEEIRGALGDYTVILSENGEKHRRHVDMVCLTDEELIPLSIPEDISGLKKLYRYNFKFFHTPRMGLYRVMPRTLNRVNAAEAGAALAAQVATAAAEAFLKDYELSPRVNPDRCRGCGRCAEICPFDAIRMVADPQGIFTSEVLRHNCVGCGGCVGRCPVTAMDMPFFSNQLLKDIVQETLGGEF